MSIHPDPRASLSGSAPPRILVVDLNNFACYPSIAIGYIVSCLRASGFHVEVLSPLAHGIPSAPREYVEGTWNHLERVISFSTLSWIQRPRAFLGRVRSRRRSRSIDPYVIRETLKGLDRGFDGLLLSTYLDRYEPCATICAEAQQRGVPTLIGGPAFNLAKIAAQWLDLPGIAAVVGGEVEPYIGELVWDLLRREPISKYPGVYLPGQKPAGRGAPPLRELDVAPFPDYNDFPWDKYPNRVIPVLSGRGCGWNICRFCSDVATANGRTYRSRRLDRVLDEMETQSRRYNTKYFTMLDLKLNSNLDVWRGLARELNGRVPGAKWICSLHNEAGVENGLTRRELEAAHAAGLVRITFGLESGSQRILDSMSKGTSVEENARFLKDAAETGLSVRTTVIQGYPGETAADLDASARFLEENGHHIDRISINRFNTLPGAIFEKEFNRHPERYPGLEDLRWDYRMARGFYRYKPAMECGYRRSLRRFLRAVHEINRTPLLPQARMFDGLM